jgi:cob(I)alamin adenosyltransferase
MKTGKQSKGLIHVYIGDGKGKTSSAVGLSVRAAGRNRRVVFAQFLKSEATGELRSLETLGIRVIRSTRRLGFTFQMDEQLKAACRDEQRSLLDRVRAALADGGVDLLVLDEVIDALNTGMLDEGDLRSLVENKPGELELVLTGRCPPPWIRDAADYLSEIRKVKHPFDRGIKARIGVEK